MSIPENHQTVMPYLMLVGTSSFIEFCREVFGAELLFTRMREDGETLMHGELQIGGSTIMFAEATIEWSPQKANLFVYVENADETYQKALEMGASSIMSPSNQDYGRACGVSDPFGNIWWVTSIIN